MNKKGQAAVTDALFLLLIVTGLTAFMFSFSADYGKGIADQVNRNDSFEFVASALKTIMYQSVPRDATQVLDPKNPDQEIDYLMAIVKEDFADDGEISDNTKRNLSKSVFEVMRPVSDSHDYIFAINTAQKYVFVLLWRTEFLSATDRFGNIEVNPDEPHKMYFCNPNLSDNTLQRLSLRVGNTVETQSLINMVEFSGSSFLLTQDTSQVKAGVTLATWTATVIPDEEWNMLDCTSVDSSYFS
jgi:hypothetical protein